MTKRTSTLTTAQGDQAYRGYLIRFNALNGSCWIEKDGFRIAGATSVDDAKHTIDTVLF